jgi:hypothetical protein
MGGRRLLCGGGGGGGENSHTVVSISFLHQTNQFTLLFSNYLSGGVEFALAISWRGQRRMVLQLLSCTRLSLRLQLERAEENGSAGCCLAQGWANVDGP